MGKREYKVDPETGEVISCPGSNIPMLVLTEEEKALEITLARIGDEYEMFTSKDFLEYTSNYLMNPYVFAGYLIGIFPDRSLEFIEVMNSKYFEVIGFEELFGYDEAVGMPEYYNYVCNFANLTIKTKARFNELLLSVKHYYENN